MPGDLGSFFDQLEAENLKKAKAEIAAEQADPAFRERVLKRMAEREAEPDPVIEPEEPEEDDDEHNE